MKDTREDILFTAFKHFLLQSYKEVTLEHLVRELGLSKGGFYHHFKSKQELFIEVIDHFVLHHIEFDKVKVDKRKTIEENLLHFISLNLKLFERFLTRITPEADEINYYRMMLDAAKYYPDFTKVVNEKHKKGELAYYRQLVENALKKGEIRADIDPGKLAETLQFLLDGIGFNFFFQGDCKDYMIHLKRGLEYFFEMINVRHSGGIK